MKRTIFNVTSYLVLFVALQLLVVTIVNFVATSVFHTVEGNPVTLLVGSAVTNVAVVALFLSLKMSPVNKEYLLSRPWATLAWSVVCALGVVLPSVWLQELLPPLPDVVSEQMMKMMRVPGGYFVIAVLAPVAEELVFRGAILRQLSETLRSRWTAIAISALLFALVHGNPAQMPHAFAMGLILGWMYCRTKSIVPGVAFHWCNNTVAYFLSIVLPDPDAKLIDLYGGNETSLILSLVSSLCIFVPSIVQLNMRMKR